MLCGDYRAYDKVREGMGVAFRGRNLSRNICELFGRGVLSRFVVEAAAVHSQCDGRVKSHYLTLGPVFNSEYRALRSFVKEFDEKHFTGLALPVKWAVRAHPVGM